MAIRTVELTAAADLYYWDVPRLVDRVLALEAQLAEKDSWFRVTLEAAGNGLSVGGGAASLPPG